MDYPYIHFTTDYHKWLAILFIRETTDSELDSVSSPWSSSATPTRFGHMIFRDHAFHTQSCFTADTHCSSQSNVIYKDTSSNAPTPAPMRHWTFRFMRRHRRYSSRCEQAFSLMTCFNIRFHPPYSEEKRRTLPALSSEVSNRGHCEHYALHYASLLRVVKLVTYLATDNKQNGDYLQALPARMFRHHFELSFNLSRGLPRFLP
jgi:hypothetical protein